MSIAQAFAAEFDQEIPGVRKHLERIPADKLGWAPHEKSMTTVQLASHIVNILNWLQRPAAADNFDLEPPGEEPWTPPKLESVEAIVSEFDSQVPKSREALLTVTDEGMQVPWSLLKGGQSLMTMPRVVCLRTMIFNHLVHHRAQLGVYLRMNDVPVPGVYGPSADEG
jgi:uncharacterized damage-inducible protein DinB